MSTDQRARAWVEVDGAALEANYRRIRDRLGEGGRLIPMVKADAYGIGVERVARRLEPLEPLAYGVATPAEGAELRALGVERPVVIFAPCAPGEVDAVVRHRLTPSVSDVGTLAPLGDSVRAASVGESLPFQIEIDTGMGRSGFDWRRVDRWGPAVSDPPDGLRWQGAFTHFHSADVDEASIRRQWGRFAEALDAMKPPSGDFVVHAANSAAALRIPGHLPPVARPGIFLYGGRVGPGLERPEPVASVRARVVHVRDAPEGTTVGYGATHAAPPGGERWATLAIGYGDGLPRALGNRGEALVGGKRVPIVGRVSMDVTVVNISGLDGVEAGHVATLVGRDGPEEITVDDVADRVGTIGYEILTGLTSRLPRIWTAGDLS